MSGLFPHRFSPARGLSPLIRSTPERDNPYLAELLAEHHKLAPFVQVLPICTRLLNHEIALASGMLSKQAYGDYDIVLHGSPSPMGSPLVLHGSPSPMGSPSPISNIGERSLGGWGGHHQEKLRHPPGMAGNWQGPPASPNSYIVKKILRLEIPVDNYPNFNFVGRLLGPRGNSLKRVEASTNCRVYIRGKGSIKDPEKEEKFRGRPGYEHLDDPLHILVEAELPANIIDSKMREAQEIIEELLKPVDESRDFYKKHQLRELAMLNSKLKEDSPCPRGSPSPFGNGLKRAKTEW